jgi:hypothetical protein
MSLAQLTMIYLAQMLIIYMAVWCITSAKSYVGSARLIMFLRPITRYVNSSMYFSCCWNHLEKPAAHTWKWTHGKILWVHAICRRKFKPVQHMQARLQTDRKFKQWLVWVQPRLLVIFAHQKNTNGFREIRWYQLERNWWGPEPMEFDIPHRCDIPRGHLQWLPNWIRSGELFFWEHHLSQTMLWQRMYFFLF